MTQSVGLNSAASVSPSAALYTRVWDVADYVVPPAENGAFFVATNVIITPNQTRGFCPEDNFDVKGVDCNPDPVACDAAYNAITITGKEGRVQCSGIPSRALSIIVAWLAKPFKTW